MEPGLPTATSRVALPRTSPEVLAGCAQALRAVRGRGGEVQTIGVTSSVPGEGRSTVAAGAVIASARSLGRRTVLIDLDSDGWRKRSESGTEGREIPSRAWDFVEWVNADVGVLRLGSHVDAATLTRAQVGLLLAELTQRGVDCVADLSCLPPRGSGDQFAGLFDVVMLVVRAGSTPEEVVRRAALSLDEPPVVMLNRTASAIPRWLRGIFR